MVRRFTKYITLPCAVLLACASVFPSAAGATATSLPNPIHCGLAAGVNLSVKQAEQCLKSGQFSTTQPPTTGSVPAPGVYAALGDSVAAGLGLPRASNATSADIRCGRSPLGYPNIVAANLNFALLDAACSGATAGDLITKQRVSGPNIVSQLDTAFASGTPKLITITAGANDAHWTTFVRACAAGNCATKTATTAAQAYLSFLSLKLPAVFSSIQARSGGAPPQVLITGYYNPVSANCSAMQSRVTPDELAWIQRETDLLNQTIINGTAGFPFVQYVPLDFTGHDVCSADPWVQGIRDIAPLHPTAQGQQAIAASVTAAVR